MAVVDVLTSGRTKDSVLALCAHNIWLIAAIFNISIHIEDIPGKNNVVADLLSIGSNLILPPGSHSTNMSLISCGFTLILISPS